MYTEAQEKGKEDGQEGETEPAWRSKERDESKLGVSIAKVSFFMNLHSFMQCSRLLLYPQDGLFEVDPKEMIVRRSLLARFPFLSRLT